MQTALLPKSMCNSLDKINRSFMWGSTQEKRKIRNVKWEKVIKPKQEGGLNICPTYQANVAQFAKPGWKLCGGKYSFWTDLFNSRYLKREAHHEL